MRKLFLNLAMLLPMLAFSFCSDDSDPVTPTLNGGDGPIEEPILAFYQDRDAIKSQEKRKLLEDVSTESVEALCYQGATSAVSVTYLFTEGKMTSASTMFEPKNSDRVLDFLRGKYVEVDDEDENAYEFETKDHLVSVSVISTIASTNVTYMRQYTDEQVNGVYVEPYLRWGADADEIKASEKRNEVSFDDAVITFSKSGIWGEVSYYITDYIGLTSVTVHDIPGIAYDKVMEQIEENYVPHENVSSFKKTFLSKDGKTILGILLQDRTEFSLMYIPNKKTE